MDNVVVANDFQIPFHNMNVTAIIFCQVSDKKDSIDIKNPLGLACKVRKVVRA
jgi:hypothetical protein